MAKATNKILLGFVDEPITDNNSDDSYTINKIGGLPDSSNQVTLPECSLCGFQTPLLAQIYAPLTNSKYHRTLYIHACVNPACWNKSESWHCLRRQWVALDSDVETKQTSTFIEWCDDADDWGDTPIVEENGNVNGVSQAAVESCATASAELETPDGDNNVVVESIETPVVDVLQLLDTRKEIPVAFHNDVMQFEPFYISVAFEESTDTKKALTENTSNSIKNSHMLVEDNNEGYEKSVPIHGDKLFESFSSAIRKTPGQVLRYCRDGGKPLFLYEQEEPLKCRNCQGKLKFELQILPSLITYLKLMIGKDQHGSGHLEFGTALVYTCEKSCWTETTDTFKYETILVQEEKLF
ncbi:programmed cell death protein 2-like [Adelges cooleyi]|uniref:programmed cell death protein 2-like n=1 Tax=Adelges cooleyi TaxID=133065 RepID=UPI00217FC1F0|nr:programmed cell death protein 2-like [Adelges cooleyi]